VRDNVITIKNGDQEAQVVESSFERVWKDKGWKKVEGKGDAKPAANVKTATSTKPAAKKTTASGSK
jgi:hypothetical protein